MADLGPSRKRIAQVIRMLGSSGGERRNAFAALERVMQSEGLTWTDIGDVIEYGDEDKYSESELQEYGQALRAEGFEAGIKVGMSRANGNAPKSNGHIVLPDDSEMADYCHMRQARLEAKHHKFIDEVHTRRRTRSLRERGYLASLYIRLGGRG